MATKYRQPLKLVYYEAYADKLLAQGRERQLKNFGSAHKGLLKRIKLN